MGAKLAAVLGWFGTILGALALILALGTAPTTWASHHHALFVLLVVSLVVCLMIAVLGPLAVAIIGLESMADNAPRFVARNRHPDVHPRTVITADVAELRAALSGGQPPA